MGLFTVHNQGGSIFFSKHKSNMYTFVQPRGVSIFPPKTQKCHVYFCTTKRGGGSRRDPNHKSMYKCAYMYVHLSLSPPPAGCRSIAYLLWKYEDLYNLFRTSFCNIPNGFCSFLNPPQGQNFGGYKLQLRT